MSSVESKKVKASELKEVLQKATSAVLVDARGLTVEQDTVLRRQLRQAGIEYKVYKNSTMRFAIKETPYEGLSEFLTGPSTLALSFDDPTAAARVINKNLKDMKVLEFKGGVIDGVTYDAEKVKAIADIPSKEELLSRLLGDLKFSVGSFARVIKAVAEKDA